MSCLSNNFTLPNSEFSRFFLHTFRQCNLIGQLKQFVKIWNWEFVKACSEQLNNQPTKHSTVVVSDIWGRHDTNIVSNL